MQQFIRQNIIFIIKDSFIAFIIQISDVLDNPNRFLVNAKCRLRPTDRVAIIHMLPASVHCSRECV